MNKKLLKLAMSVSLTAIAFTQGASAETRLLKQGAISKDHIAFVYGGDIWVSDRDGDNPRQLTTRRAPEMMPQFSPDGKTIAFSAEYDGNTDVYTIPVSGGQPTRLTWHPGADIVEGFTPSGEDILFTSRREMTSGRSAQAWHVSVKGGFPTKVMDAVMQSGTWDAAGERIAYQPYNTAHRGASGWRNHRGGSTPPIWILTPSNGEWEEVPHERASDTNPMWVGDDVYFLSDRSGMKNVWKYDTSSKSVSMVTDQKDWDISWARAHGTDILVTTTAGDMMMVDTRRGRTRAVDLTIATDLPEARPQWKDAMPNLTGAGLSPTGKRAVVTARGDVYTVPLKDGSTRNLTRSAGVNETSGLWSPKGGEIAYISDEGGALTLVIADQSGDVKRSFALGEDDYSLVDWSAGGEKILYADNHLGVWSINAATGERTKIYTDNRRSGVNISLSSDGKWLAYTKARRNYFNDVFLYSFDDESHTQITDGMSHAVSPAFSPDGNYLYFAASTNAGPTSVGLDMSTQERPIRFGLYAAVLAADGKSPLLPKSDDEDEKSADASESGSTDDSDEKDGAAKKDGVTVKVDLAGLSDRIVSLPVAERAYSSLQVAGDGALFFLETDQPGGTIEPNGRGRQSTTLMRFDFEDKKAAKAMDMVQGYSISADGKHVIVNTQSNGLMTAKAVKDVKAEKLNTSDVKAFINPKEEWAQIFDEAWRFEKQYFYAANMHGLDWDAVYKKYQPLVQHVATRADLNRLLVDMISEMEVGHNRTGGGDIYRDDPIQIGLLGANLRVVDGKYQVARIFSGENWNPFVNAPLAAPGIGVNEGDFIHSVNGAPVSGADNIYAHFIQTVGKQVTLGVSSDGNAANARDVVVEPIANERQLRHWAWVEGNRKKVEEATDGKVGYVYLPNTGGGGFTYFNRMFFAQTDKQAMIIDERQNGGGQAANYITDILSRQYLSGWQDRDGMTFDTPGGAVFGPKVMLIDQDAGSGGDFLPYSFRRMGLGKLIGKRTWGGLIGISTNPRLIDGGFLTVPFFRFYTPEGKWEVENMGVGPDIDVTLDPARVNAGDDTQLERAISEVLKELETYTPVKRNTPPATPTEVGG